MARSWSRGRGHRTGRCGSSDVRTHAAGRAASGTVTSSAESPTAGQRSRRKSHTESATGGVPRVSEPARVYVNNGDTFTVKPRLLRNRLDKANAKKPTAGRKDPGFRLGYPRTSSYRSRATNSLPYQQRYLSRSGQKCRVPLAGRATRPRPSMHKATEIATAPHSTTLTGTQFPRFTSPPLSSLPEVNSQTARRRLDTSLSSPSSLHSRGWYRRIERCAVLHTHTSPQERRELGELGGIIPFESVDYLVHFGVGTQQTSGELGGER